MPGIEHLIPPDEFKILGDLKFEEENIFGSLQNNLLQGMPLLDAIKNFGIDKALSLSGLNVGIQNDIKNNLPAEEVAANFVLPKMLGELPIPNALKNALIGNFRFRKSGPEYRFSKSMPLGPSGRLRFGAKLGAKSGANLNYRYQPNENTFVEAGARLRSKGDPEYRIEFSKRFATGGSVTNEIKDGGALERLKDFFAEQIERKIERDMMMAEAQRAAIEELTPTKAQAAWGAAQFAPGGAWIDASGNMVLPPSSDVELRDLPEYMLEGEKMPSMAEHLGQGGWGYLHAGLQGLGSLGDAAYGIPFVGPVAGTVLKAPGAVGKIAKAALTARRVGKGKEIDEGIGALPRAGATTGSKKTIYHSTDEAFDDFDVTKSADGSIWFSDDLEKVSGGYEGATGSKRVVEKIIDENNLKLAGWDESDKYLNDQLIQMGYDGIKYEDAGSDTVYQIFNPDKLKAVPAIDNYPLAPIDNWYSGADFQQRGGNLVNMTPDTFLDNAAPLKIDDVTRENIDELKRHILDGGELDPLELFSGDRAVRGSDGRHRAIAAKELGLDEIPVLDFRAIDGGNL